MAATSDLDALQPDIADEDAFAVAITASQQDPPNREEADFQAAIEMSLTEPPNPEKADFQAAISMSLGRDPEIGFGGDAAMLKKELLDSSPGYRPSKRIRLYHKTSPISCNSSSSNSPPPAEAASSSSSSSDSPLPGQAALGSSSSSSNSSSSNCPPPAQAALSSSSSCDSSLASQAALGSSSSSSSDGPLPEQAASSTTNVLHLQDAGGASAPDDQIRDMVSEGGVAGGSADPDGWIVVAETVLKKTTVESRRTYLHWLKERVESGELKSEIYTGRKLWDRQRGSLSYERTEIAPSLLFPEMPEIDQERLNFQESPWWHTLGLLPSEDTFKFQRVRVQGVKEGESQVEWSTSLTSRGEVRIVVEWNPSLAVQHMAAYLGFHAANVFLTCKIAPVQPPDWKPAVYAEWYREDEESESGDFFLRGCGNEIAAVQPPRFRRFPLRPEQLRSLRWMVDREARPANFDTEVHARYVPSVGWDSQPEKWNDFPSRFCADYWQAYGNGSGFSWCYDLALKANFSIAGGVLGDAIGSGKTATLIGLLDTQRKLLRKQVPYSPPESRPEAAHLINTDATLLLVPSNLLGQWEGEFTKFLGPDAFNFLVIRSIADLSKMTVEDLRDREIVLTTYKLFYSPKYIERLRSLQCTRTNHLHERSFLGAPIEKTLAAVEEAEKAVLASGADTVGWTLRHKTNAEIEAHRDAETDHTQLLSDEEVTRRIDTLGLCKDWKKMPHPVFELFFWHRIVFDEFHELEAMDKRRRCMLENLRSQCRWGLTGTPPKRDKEQIVCLARMLRVRLQGDDLVQCQHFLDTFVRQNFSELPEIPVKEHIIHVEQTLEERALYLQQAFDSDRRKLLQFCSHHCLDREQDQDHGELGLSTAPSARHSVDRLESKKREGQKKQMTIVQQEYLALAALYSDLQEGQQATKAESDAGAKLSELEAQVRAVNCPSLGAFLEGLPTAGDGPSLATKALDGLDLSRPGADRCAGVLRAIKRSARVPLVDLRSVRAAQYGRCHASLAKLLSMTRSLRFLEATLGMLRSSDGSGEAQECPMCLEAMKPDEAVLLPCAHAFHLNCCVELVKADNHFCPSCRAPFKTGDWVTVNSATSKQAVKHDAEDIETYGSKLVSIAKTLKSIHKKDPKAKAIVFVQWKELEALVGNALQRMGIEHARLAGTTVQRSRLIAAFQEKGPPWVLVQSLENSASGANMTRASHVLLVHPMDACSQERAVAYEMQALGRVRRCGQEAKEVHLWRFVTKGTVEEEISREHQVGVASSIHSSSCGQAPAASSSSHAEASSSKRRKSQGRS